MYALLSLFNINMIFVWCRRRIYEACTVAETQLAKAVSDREKTEEKMRAVDEAEVKKNTAKVEMDEAEVKIIQPKWR